MFGNGKRRECWASKGGVSNGILGGYIAAQESFCNMGLFRKFGERLCDTSMTVLSKVQTGAMRHRIMTGVFVGAKLS